MKKFIIIGFGYNSKVIAEELIEEEDAVTVEGELRGGVQEALSVLA